MFGLFKKDPTKKMRAEYAKILEQAMLAQRNGNIELYAKLSKQADDLINEIEKLEQTKNS